MGKITRCVFDWFSTNENGEEYSVWETEKDRAGSNVRVVSLLEHLPSGDGDVHYVEAALSDGTKVRTYNVNQVTEKLTDEDPF